MTAKQFRNIQESLGVMNAAMGSLLGGYHEQTVVGWRHGRRAIPPAVAVLMELLKECPEKLK